MSENTNVRFANWTLGVLRKENTLALSWLEEIRYEWCKVAYHFIDSVIHKGSSIILCTDSKREWFGRYILQHINIAKSRPLLPIFYINSVVENSVDLNTQLMEDMFNIAFKNHIVWYIGRTDNRLSTLAIEHQNSFIWAFDSNLHTAFHLDSAPGVDIKLLQLYDLLDKSIDAIMFGEINYE
ncbi:HobA family DNA replication regulator [Helicobacter sp. 23-1045]